MRINNPPLINRIISTDGSIIKPTVYAVDGTHEDVTWDIDRPLLRKQLQMGPWNMDANQALNVVHGIDTTLYQITHIEAIVRSDTVTEYNIPLFDSSSFIVYNGGMFGNFSATNIVLRRLDAGLFDALLFDDEVINRGIINIEYQLL